MNASFASHYSASAGERRPQHPLLPRRRRSKPGLAISHVLNDVFAKLGALDFRRAFHLAGEIVGDALAGDRAVQAFDDQIRRFDPAHVAEHHFAGEHHGAGIDDVLVRILRRGAVRGFENGVAGDVIDVAAGRDADAADLRGERVAQIIAVQIQRRDHVEIVRTREHLLERDVGDGVLDHDARAVGLSFAAILHHGPPSISTAPNAFFASS